MGAMDGKLAGGASGLGALAGASPWGAVANAAAQIAATPNTSAATAGDFSGGSTGGFGIGIQGRGASGGFSLPWYAWAAIGVVALVVILRRK